jgi:hypothetical protein
MNIYYQILTEGTKVTGKTVIGKLLFVLPQSVVGNRELGSNQNQKFSSTIGNR